MRTIDIGIGHDDNLVVCQLGDVGLVRVFFGAYGDAQRSEQVGNFFVLEDFVLHGLLDVENLAAQRKYGLIATVASILSRTACRITFDYEDFAVFGRA